MRVSNLKEALSDLLIDVTEEQVMKLHLANLTKSNFIIEWSLK